MLGCHSLVLHIPFSQNQFKMDYVSDSQSNAKQFIDMLNLSLCHSILLWNTFVVSQSNVVYYAQYFNKFPFFIFNFSV